MHYAPNQIGVVDKRASDGRGGANYRVKMALLNFNFKSARGANYRKYGIKFSL